MTTHRTWGGRFTGTLAEAMLRLSASVDVDRALAEDDIRGSIAHARALARAGVLDQNELARMVEGLETVLREVKAGTMKWREDLEDVHMNVEARLVELVGPLGGKLHTGRSRNDQVATDLRLWARRAAHRHRRGDRPAVARHPRPRRRAPHHAATRLHASAARAARPPRAPSFGLVRDAPARSRRASTTRAAA